MGQIGATGESILLAHVAKSRRWAVDQQWVAHEAIKSFAGHALKFRGEILGVLALFSRDRLTPADFDWLRAFADQAAVAIANARAFEEINRLRNQLESENSYLAKKSIRQIGLARSSAKARPCPRYSIRSNSSRRRLPACLFSASRGRARSLSPAPFISAVNAPSTHW